MDESSLRYASPADTTHSYSHRFGQTYQSVPRYASPADNAHKYSPAPLRPGPITRTSYNPVNIPGPVRAPSSLKYGQPAEIASYYSPPAQILAPVRIPVPATLQYTQPAQILPRPTVPCGAHLLIGCSQSIQSTACGANTQSAQLYPSSVSSSPLY